MRPTTTQRGESVKPLALRDCPTCRTGFHPSRKSNTYCSSRCRDHRDRGTQPCEICGGPAKLKAKTCSRECFRALFARIADAKPKTHSCVHCGAGFRASPSTLRKYCSYACHLASGGAVRAGNAAALAIMSRYGAKKDANHAEFVAAMRKLGLSILDVSSLGNGLPDLIVYVPRLDAIQLVEIKNPKTGYGRRGLNKLQTDWAQAWKGSPVYIVRTLDDVMALAEGRLADLQLGLKVAA